MDQHELDATLSDDGPHQDEAEASELADMIGWDCVPVWMDGEQDTGDEQ